MLHVGKWVQERGGFIVLICSNRDKGSETNMNFVQTNKENRGIFTLKLRNSHFDLFNKGENWRAVPCRCHVCSPNSCPFRLRSSSLLRNCCFNQFPKKTTTHPLCDGRHKKHSHTAVNFLEQGFLLPTSKLIISWKCWDYHREDCTLCTFCAVIHLPAWYRTVLQEGRI